MQPVSKDVTFQLPSIIISGKLDKLVFMRALFTLGCRTNKDRQDMSRHILLYLSYGFFPFSSLFKSTVIFVYGIYLIIPAQSTNSKDGVSISTISTIQFFMAS